ncbi:hypothetical protein BaRGS_00036243 [Batillaria attramentaria]|uniref:Uncharacterized protein n=1 Tax=Batillaria attramentaria TaxID=370345 RepID=A0ABD0JCY9_9CAEN
MVVGVHTWSGAYNKAVNQIKIRINRIANPRTVRLSSLLDCQLQIAREPTDGPYQSPLSHVASSLITITAVSKQHLSPRTLSTPESTKRHANRFPSKTYNVYSIHVSSCTPKLRCDLKQRHSVQVVRNKN